jgi:Flp pilus assembly protein TadD
MGTVYKEAHTKPLPPDAEVMAILVMLCLLCDCEEKQAAEEREQRGNLPLENGSLDAEIKRYSEAIRLKPDFAEAYNDRGVAYEMKGDTANAEKDFERAKQLGYEPEGGPNEEVS